jgi:xylan 1,4-beta-xylosidase
LTKIRIHKGMIALKYHYNQEVIQYTNGLPIKLYVCRIESVPFHWHQEMEIIYLVQGELQVNIENQRYHLQKENLVLINTNEVHSFQQTDKENLAIVIQLDLKRFKGYYPQIEKTHFFCNSLLDKNAHEKYIILKKFLSKILHVYDQKEPGFIIELNIIIQQIILHLIRGFEKTVINEENLEKSSDNLKRLERILKYIDEHYTEKITLDEIAKSEYISTYYFSHFFKDKMGMTFQTYLKHVRLKKAHNMLLETDEKIVDIAHKSGFANSQMFASYFKEEFGMTPTQLRNESFQGAIMLENDKAVDQHKYIDEDIKTVLNSF